MVKIQSFAFLVRVLSILCCTCVSLGYLPDDNFLINCGSLTNMSVGNRTFGSDESYSEALKTSQHILANTSLDSVSSDFNDSQLYKTARIFKGASNYTFHIQSPGRYWIRLHFAPFNFESYNMSLSKFSVSAHNIILIRIDKLDSGPIVKEYSLDITSDKLVLQFTPLSDSFAFINALEIFSLPGELIPEEVSTIGSQGDKVILRREALETVHRVNMGNVNVNPLDDSLWRSWVADGPFMSTPSGGPLSNISAVKFTENITDIFAPSHVYGTAIWLNTNSDPHMVANLTWGFNVDIGFKYLVRLHFCNILSSPVTIQPMTFRVYIDSLFVDEVHLNDGTSNVLGTPYFMDVLTEVRENSMLNVSMGSFAIGNNLPDAILNGLEIMKLNNTRGSLDVSDTIHQRSPKPKNIKVVIGIIAGVAALLFIAVCLALVLFILCRRRRKLAHVGHSRIEDGNNGAANFSSTKTGYLFPLSVIREATDDFSENLVLGLGGFGKVYKGVLRDETVVAVKRGTHQTHQGLAEFTTEIEMLSQFRHRHLVSLIGYCDEKDEMIIVYEYMANGTLKDHLYGSDLPKLSWRQRLDICIGSARGLHYLHTGSAKAIIHRDVKSANILLDETFIAKVADFGLSKMGPELDQTHVSTAVKGSFGYLDPEYLIRQQLTEKSDVYSFGVVMFEIMCGRPVIDPSLPREKVNLVEWAMKLKRNGKLEEIIDPYLVNEVKPDSLKKYGELAEKCLAEHGVDRPSMGDVLWNLECALQLQCNEEKPNVDDKTATIVSTTQFSSSSVNDIAGISMSKVFAQMVREDTRQDRDRE